MRFLFIGCFCRLLRLAFIFLIFENIAGKPRNDENSVGLFENIAGKPRLVMTRNSMVLRNTKDNKATRAQQH